MKNLSINILLTGVLVVVSLFSFYINSIFQKRLISENQQVYQKRTLSTPTIIPSPSPTPIPKTSVFLTGDVMLGRKVMIQAKKMSDPIFPFRKVADKLREADTVFINMENPIIKNCPIHEGGFKFCASPDMIEGLEYAGVDVVTLANNHSANYGQEGLRQTVNYLEERKILHAGLNNLAIKQFNNATFGFLGFDFTVKALNDADLELIKNADRDTEVLIVGVHWGVEYTEKPTEVQRGWASQMIGAGADVIVGHHPHWVQVMECFEVSRDGATVPHPVWISLTHREITCPSGTKPIYYSLGNFIFDQMWSEETKKGVVVELAFDGKNLVEQKIHKTYIRNWGQVEFVEE